MTAATQTVPGKLVLKPAIDNQLRTAIKHDNITGFRNQYPKTVTPQVVG